MVSPSSEGTASLGSEQIIPSNVEETTSLDPEKTDALDTEKTNLLNDEEIAFLNSEETTDSDAEETTTLNPAQMTSSDVEEASSLGPEETTPADAEKTTSLDAKRTRRATRALVPQVASYLVMPNALFSAGFTDLNNQNALLNNMRTTLFEPESKTRIFLSSYGNKIILSSSRSPLHYGYGAEVRYAAVQTGFTLAEREGKNSTTNLGIMGTYGKLAFTPKEMEDAEKSILDKWSLTAYGSFQNDKGIYLDTLFSYGTIKGNITTALIGNTTKLNKTKTLGASATIGQKLATHVEGLVFEPQAQFVYQRLMFGTLSDIDGFNVNMGNPYQWLLRVGGRLTQTVSVVERNRVVSFYGKVNIIKTFDDQGTIQIGDTLHLDPMGSSVEGGFGVNAQLSHNFALHGDVSYQRKLQKAGISGTNFSGGIRYQF